MKKTIFITAFIFFAFCSGVLYAQAIKTTESIHEAITRGDYKSVKRLLERTGRTINWRDGDQKETLLHIATKANYPEIIELIIEKGAEINAVDNDGHTALHSAAFLGQGKAAAILIKANIDISIKNTDGATALHLAAARGANDIILMLVEKGADINVRDKKGETPLHRVARYGRPRTVKLLVEKGADINALDNDGITPLVMALRENRPVFINTAEALVEAGADVNMKLEKKDNITPLHAAAALGNLQITELLVKKGADVNATDTQGKTPLDYAEKKRNKDVANYLTGLVKKKDEKK